LRLAQTEEVADEILWQAGKEVDDEAENRAFGLDEESDSRPARGPDGALDERPPEVAARPERKE
jgi:hypothetical protein